MTVQETHDCFANAEYLLLENEEKYELDSQDGYYFLETQVGEDTFEDPIPDLSSEDECTFLEPDAIEDKSADVDCPEGLRIW